MSFQESADSWRAKLHVGGKRLPILVGVTVAVVLALSCAGKLIFDAVASDGFAVEHTEPSVQTTAGAEGETQKPTIKLIVQVGGAVVAPGVYELPEGSRVNDAVSLAGGLAPSAAVDAFNLARTLNDGEQIVVPSQAEVEAAVSTSPNAPASSGQSPPTSPGGLVNINRATADQLDALPGVGASTAEKIVADREANGPFKATEDLKRVSGIGDKKFESLADLICV